MRLWVGFYGVFVKWSPIILMLTIVRLWWCLKSWLVYGIEIISSMSSIKNVTSNVGYMSYYMIFFYECLWWVNEDCMFYYLVSLRLRLVVDSVMGHYSYSAQSITRGLLQSYLTVNEESVYCKMKWVYFECNINMPYTQYMVCLMLWPLYISIWIMWIIWCLLYEL